MEKDTQQNKSNVDFTNLKNLNSLIGGSEINSFVNNLKSAKQNLDNYCKNLKEVSANAKVKAESAVKVQQSVPETKSTTIQVTNNDNSVKSNTTNFSNTKTSETETSLPQSNNKATYQNREYSANKDYNQNREYKPRYNNENGNRYNRTDEQKPYNQNGGEQKTYNSNGPRPYNNNNGERTYNNNGPRPYNNAGQRPYNNNNGEQRPYNPNGPRPYNNGGQRPYNNNNGEQRPYNNNGPRPYNNNNGDRPYNNNGPRPYNNGEQRSYNPNGPRPYNNGPRPFTPFNKDKDGKPIGNGTRPLGPKSTFVPRGEVVSFVPKTDIVKKDKPKQKGFEEKKGLNIKAKIRMGVVDFDNSNAENEERIGRVKVKSKKQRMNFTPEKINIEHATITTDNLTVKILSEKIGKPAAEIIKKFMLLGMMLNINSPIDYATAELVTSEFGITLEQKLEKTAEEKLQDNILESGNDLRKRPPIVTVMGHVDHGKTSLLDAIKKTNVISTEAGGITQHIGAYSVSVNNRKITFIDTPGHEAFTSMRARGAQITDLAILVVAADDGIMPQTVEAINHIKAAGVPMLVAINKIDKPEANVEKIKQQLTEHEVIPEEWGGDVICVPISAKSGLNIDKLLEMILLVADVKELKAYYDCPAVGTVVESKVDKGRGIVATIIIKEGILKVGDYVICGLASGRVRAMMDYLGNNVISAEPSMAVSVVGLNTVPDAGEQAYVVEEKLAKNILYERQTKVQNEKAQHNNGASLEDFLQQSADSELKILKLIIKADVQGSCEAVKQTLEKVRNDEVIVKCIHNGVGSITESDVLLAKASSAIIIGFNIKPEIKAKTLAERNDVEIKIYRVIYEAVDEITNTINGMQAPKFEERILGHAEIRKVFKISALGNIAGCYVLDGVIGRKNKIRVKRDGEELAVVTIENLQQNKDDAKEVKSGFECGIKLKGYNDIKELDILEAFEEVQIN